MTQISSAFCCRTVSHGFEPLLRSSAVASSPMVSSRGGFLAYGANDGVRREDAAMRPDRQDLDAVSLCERERRSPWDAEHRIGVAARDEQRCARVEAIAVARHDRDSSHASTRARTNRGESPTITDGMPSARNRLTVAREHWSSWQSRSIVRSAGALRLILDGLAEFQPDAIYEPIDYGFEGFGE
jgi:hypothetical protein